MPVPVGFLLWQFATEAHMVATDMRGITKAHHAPPGGEDFGGQHYAGGEFSRDPNQEVVVIHAPSVPAMEASPREAREWAIANIVGEHRNQSTGWEVVVSAKGIREGINKLKWPQKLAIKTLAAVPDLICHAVPVHSAPDLKGRPEVISVRTLVAPLEVEGEVFRAVMTVRQTTMGHRYHGHQLESIDIEMPEALSVGLTPEGSWATTQHSGTFKLGHLLRGFKPTS